jgi:hypothetical protein
MHSGAQIVRVLQERLQSGHWANANQLQRWHIEDEVAKLVHAGYIEKFGEDGMYLTDKGKAHKQSNRFDTQKRTRRRTLAAALPTDPSMPCLTN